MSKPLDPTSKNLSPTSKTLSEIVKAALLDIKGENIVELDVIGISDVTDTLIICTGASNRQVKSLANNVIEESKNAGFRPIGVEGMDGGEWVLVDFGSVVVHTMVPATRDYYDLEKLWSKHPVNHIPEQFE
jgi:ribosome-associated protein